ncbi:hypothetical protein P171DRAFT_181067 [Karstenula rhodostoma CBS 690.94]|uniref:Secreted protein n=1 Tax=Karstenula rhodostoma CBS 690.94 TaxID=1392251 RepID=A0A9P4U5U3_9PLEO|nr:hypothetical protein P171DRAFT_181067 [Karstenula rhodostoma CBS 690.94]
MAVVWQWYDVVCGMVVVVGLATDSSSCAGHTLCRRRERKLRAPQRRRGDRRCTRHGAPFWRLRVWLPLSAWRVGGPHPSLGCRCRCNLIAANARQPCSVGLAARGSQLAARTRTRRPGQIGLDDARFTTHAVWVEHLGPSFARWREHLASTPT